MLKIISLLFFLFVSVASTANDSFILDSLEEATRLSEQTQQPILLIFGSDQCGFCVNLKEDIKTGQLDSTISRYIVCYIDIKTHVEIKNKYSVSSIPDTRVLKNGKEIKKIIGYSKNIYIEKLK